jgi:hypothetical protein
MPIIVVQSTSASGSGTSVQATLSGVGSGHGITVCVSTGVNGATSVPVSSVTDNQSSSYGSQVTKQSNNGAVALSSEVWNTGATSSPPREQQAERSVWKEQQIERRR